VRSVGGVVVFPLVAIIRRSLFPSCDKPPKPRMQRAKARGDGFFPAISFVVLNRYKHEGGCWATDPKPKPKPRRHNDHRRRDTDDDREEGTHSAHHAVNMRSSCEEQRADLLRRDGGFKKITK